MSNRAGRPQKAYRTSWGEIIQGLDRQSDGRWRVIASGVRFSEADENRAIQRFRQITSTTKPLATLTVAITEPDASPAEILADWSQPLSQSIAIQPASISVVVDQNDRTMEKSAEFKIDEKVILDWVRTQLLDRPAEFAAKIGIPELAEFRRIKISQEINISTILDIYLKSNKGKRSALEAGKVFEKFINETGAKNLSDLTPEQLLNFRDIIDKSKLSPSSKKAYYSRIKTVISSGLKNGVDAVQIRQALDRLKILHCNEKNAPKNPQPISRQDFHRLMKSANDNWRAILMVSLNLCLHLGETLQLRWEDIDVARKCHVSNRNKTGITRAAMLWQETIQLLSVLPRKSQYIFISQHGTKYNRQAAGNVFSEIRARAGVSASVKFDSLRDGAYTQASHCRDGERLSRLLAGHSNGMMDNYVKAHPEVVKPATDAVYQHYLG